MFYLYYIRIGICLILLFFFKQKTAYELLISDWSSDVCTSDLVGAQHPRLAPWPAVIADRAVIGIGDHRRVGGLGKARPAEDAVCLVRGFAGGQAECGQVGVAADRPADDIGRDDAPGDRGDGNAVLDERFDMQRALARSEDETSQ